MMQLLMGHAHPTAAAGWMDGAATMTDDVVVIAEEHKGARPAP